MKVLFDRTTISYVAFCVLSSNILVSNSGFSTHWALNIEKNRIVAADTFDKTQNDQIFDILNSAITYGDYWVVEEVNLTRISAELSHSAKKSHKMSNNKKGTDNSEKHLNCGKPVKFTYYDHLKGVSNRFTHPNISEPEIAFLFINDLKENSHIYIDHLEAQLKKSVRTSTNAVHVYNQIGNFWRIIGDTHKAIECFRKALSIEPHNSDIRVNLARVLYNLDYVSDAFYLAKLSIDDGSFAKETAWFQYFTLGEILKVHGDSKEAIYNFRRSLALNPNFQPAIDQLRSLQLMSDFVLLVYVLIIMCMLVLFSIYAFQTDRHENDQPRLPRSRRRVGNLSTTSLASGMNIRTLRVRNMHS